MCSRWGQGYFKELEIGGYRQISGGGGGVNIGEAQIYMETLKQKQITVSRGGGRLSTGGVFTVKISVSGATLVIISNMTYPHCSFRYGIQSHSVCLI